MDKVYKTTKKLLVIIAFVMIALLLFPQNVLAVTPSFSISGSTSVATSQTITLTFVLTTSDSVNAVDYSANIQNLTYVSGTPNSDWTLISAPSMSGNVLSSAMAVLGQTRTGTINLIVVTLATPVNSVGATITLSGKYGLADGSGQLVTIPTQTFNITVTKPAATHTPTPTIRNATATPTTVVATQADTPTPTLNLQRQVVITSSNPFGSTWTSQTTANFSWQQSDSFIGYSYAVDDSQYSDVQNVVTTTSLAATVQNLSEGTHYFHIKPLLSNSTWGDVTTARVSVDKTAPTNLTVGVDSSTGSNILQVSAQDTTSGIYKYEISIDGSSLQAATNGMKLPSTFSTIRVFAYDYASNSSSVTYTKGSTSAKPTTTATTPYDTYLVPGALGTVAVAALGIGVYLLRGGAAIGKSVAGNAFVNVPQQPAVTQPSPIQSTPSSNFDESPIKRKL